MIPIFHAFHRWHLAGRGLCPLPEQAGHNHPDAAVEGAIHFMALNVAAVCSQLNTSGHCQEDSSITAGYYLAIRAECFPRSRRRSGGNGMHIDLFNQLQH